VRSRCRCRSSGKREQATGVTDLPVGVGDGGVRSRLHARSPPSRAGPVGGGRPGPPGGAPAVAMLTAVGCYDRPIGWRHGLHSGSTWYGPAAARGGSAVATPDLFGSVVHQHRTLQQHHRQQHQHHYQPTAAAFASLLQQASSVVAPAAALVPYFHRQLHSDDTEKPIGCGAFGVVWYVPAGVDKYCSGTAPADERVIKLIRRSRCCNFIIIFSK